MPRNLEELKEKIGEINIQFDEQGLEMEFLGKLNENGKARFNAIQVGFKEMEARYTVAIDILVPDNKINNSTIKNAISWIKTGLKVPDSYNNYNANSNFTKGFEILANLASSMPLPTSESSDRLKEAARSISSSLGQYQGRYERNLGELDEKKASLNVVIEELEEQSTSINEKWNELERNIQERTRISEQQYSELHSKFTEKQTERTEIFEGFINDIKEKETSMLNQLKSDFEMEKSDYLEGIEKDKDSILEVWEAHFEERSSNITLEFNNLKDDTDTEAKKILDDLKKKQEEAASIVGNVTNNGIAGHFAKEAKRKTISVRIWRGATIAAFIATIVVGFLLLILQVGSEDGNMGVTELIARLVVTAALGSLTAYLSKLASDDEKNRKYNSSMEIRLLTLNPYLDSFENEEQVKLKKELFPIIFREKEKNYQEANFNKTDVKDTLK